MDENEGAAVQSAPAPVATDTTTTTSAPAPDATRTAETADAAPQAGSETAPAGEATDGQNEGDKPKGPSRWVQRRIDQLTAERSEEARQRAAVEAQLAEMRAKYEPAPTQPTNDEGVQQPRQLSQAEIDRQIRNEAQRLLAERQFNDTCEGIYVKGKETHADWDATLENFKMLGGIPPMLIEAATTTEAPADVLYALGKDPDEAARIMALPPIRMTAEINKLANKAKPKVSAAPKPVTPIRGTQQVADGMGDDIPMDTWAKRFDERMAARRR